MYILELQLDTRQVFSLRERLLFDESAHEPPTLTRACHSTQTTLSISIMLFIVKRLGQCLNLLVGSNHAPNLLPATRLHIQRTFLDVGRRDRLLQMVVEDDHIQDPAFRMPSTCKPKVRYRFDQFKILQPRRALHLPVPHGCLSHEVGE